MPFFMKFGSLGDIRFSQYFLLIALAVSTTIEANSPLNIRQPEKRKVLLALIILAVMCFISTFDIYKGFALSRTIGFSLGLIIFFNLIRFKNLKTWHALVFICLTQTAWIFLQYFGFNLYNLFAPSNMQLLSNVDQKWAISTTNVISGSLGHPNLSAAMIAITVPSLFRLGFWRYVPFAVVALLLTKSSFGIGTFVITMAFWSFGSIGMLTTLAGALGVFIYGHFYGGFFSNNNRADVWLDSISLFFKQDLLSVIFGNGLGWFPSAFNSSFNYDSTYNHVHNEYLEVLFSFGFVGLFLLLFIVISFLRMNAPKYLKASFIAITFNCLANFPFHVGSLAATSILVAATIFIHRKESDDGIFSFKTRRTTSRRMESSNIQS